MELKKTWFIPSILIVLMACFTFTSCSDDKKEDEPDHTENTIIGTWKWSDSEEYELLTFKSNGTVTAAAYDIRTDEEIDNVRGSYRLDKNVLTLYTGHEVEVWTILNLSYSNLTIRYEGEYLGEYLNWGGEPEITTYYRVK